MTGPQATVLAAVCSLVSAILVAWITGAFDRDTALDQAKIDRLKEEAIEQIKQEGNSKTEQIRQLTAPMVEQARAQGTIEIEKFKLQRDLIISAINTEDRIEAQKRLRFFAETGLIPDYADKVLSFTMERPINEIPTLVGEIVRHLQPLGTRHVPISNALVEIVGSGSLGAAFCTGLAVDSNKILLMTHCVETDQVGHHLIRYLANDGTQKTSKIRKQSVIETSGPQKVSEDMSIVTLESLDAQYLDDITVRQPKLGEQVYVVGLAPSSHVGSRSIAPQIFVPFITENCQVTEISSYMGTDCVTTIGTSGSPILAESDGSLLSLVAWGKGPEETNGPLLFLFQDKLRHLVDDNFSGSR